jgi:nucleotide-binding universal stress UspA family protein
MKRILVPTDFAAASRAALDHALEFADAVGAEVVLLHVIDEEAVDPAHLSGIRELFTMMVDPTGNTFCYEALQESTDHDVYEEAQRKLTALLPPLFCDHLRTVVAAGDVADEIMRVAWEERITLIVMGIHGKQGWRRLLLERVAEKVVQQSPVPVITLWPGRGAMAQRDPPWGRYGVEAIFVYECPSCARTTERHQTITHFD